MDEKLQENLIHFIKGLQHYDFQGINNIHDIKRLCLVIASYHKQDEVLSIEDYITLISNNIEFDISDIEMKNLAIDMHEKINFGDQVLKYTK